MAVTSAPQAVPPQHLWDPKQRLHISRWHYKRESAHMGSFHMIVGNVLTIFPKSVVIVSFLCCYTISFDCSPSCCGFDHVVPCLHCGYFYFWLISSKHIYFENLSYIKKQPEQAAAQSKKNHIIKAFDSESLCQLPLERPRLTCLTNSSCVGLGLMMLKRGMACP